MFYSSPRSSDNVLPPRTAKAADLQTFMIFVKPPTVHKQKFWNPYSVQKNSSL